MCLIIETRKEITIPKFVMEDMHKSNRDGYGFMYVRNGHTVGEKYEGKTVDELYDKYLELKEFEPYIHLRMKTHGDINPDQSHPYYCGHGIWLMHNGILADLQGEDKSKSDSWYLANDYLLPLFNGCKDPEALVAMPAFQHMLTKFIGTGNRIVLLDRNIGGLRFNDSIWHTITNEDTKCVGMKVSNTYAWNLHTKPRPVIYSGGGRSHYSGNVNHSYYSHGSSQGNKGNPSLLVPPGVDKTESKPNDPPGSFRDKDGELWVYNGHGWLKYNHYKNLYPNAPDTLYTKFSSGSEVPQSHPTLVKVAESDSSKSGTAPVNVKSSEFSEKEQQSQRRRRLASFIENETDEDNDDDTGNAFELDAYQDWLNDEWGVLDYQAICERVIQEPEEAADLISFCLAIKIPLDGQS